MKKIFLEVCGNHGCKLVLTVSMRKNVITLRQKIHCVGGTCTPLSMPSQKKCSHDKSVLVCHFDHRHQVAIALWVDVCLPVMKMKSSPLAQNLSF